MMKYLPWILVIAVAYAVGAMYPGTFNKLKGSVGA